MKYFTIKNNERKKIEKIYTKILTADVGFQVILYFVLRGCLYFQIFLKMYLNSF